MLFIVVWLLCTQICFFTIADFEYRPCFPRHQSGKGNLSQEIKRRKIPSLSNWRGAELWEWIDRRWIPRVAITLNHHSSGHPGSIWDEGAREMVHLFLVRWSAEAGGGEISPSFPSYGLLTWWDPRLGSGSPTHSASKKGGRKTILPPTRLVYKKVQLGRPSKSSFCQKKPYRKWEASMQLNKCMRRGVRS